MKRLVSCLAIRFCGVGRVAACLIVAGLVVLAGVEAAGGIVYTYSGQANFQTIDLNNDSTPDFQISLDEQVEDHFIDCMCGCYLFVEMELSLVGIGSNGIGPGTFTPGYSIGSQIQFGGVKWLADYWEHTKTDPNDPMCENTVSTIVEQSLGTGILGLRFQIGGLDHYGWARVDVTGTMNNERTLIDYAYEDQAGVPVLIPEPGTVSLLGIALIGLLGCGWRRMRTT